MISDFIRDLGSVVIVIHRWKGGKWRSKKRQTDRNVIVERYQKLGILVGNACKELNKTSKIYSYINRVIDREKSILIYFFYLDLSLVSPAGAQQFINAPRKR